jgi:hypothetical protein
VAVYYKDANYSLLEEKASTLLRQFYLNPGFVNKMWYTKEAKQK